VFCTHKSNPAGAWYVTLHITVGRTEVNIRQDKEKPTYARIKEVNIRQFGSGKWFSPVYLLSLLHRLEKSVINIIWLLPIFDCSIIIIGPSGLPLVLPTYLWSLFQSYGWVCQKVYSVERPVSRHLVVFKPLLFYWMISWQCFWKTKCKLAMGAPMTLSIT
jgi:hypothetical protein